MCCLLCRAGSVSLSNSGCYAAGGAVSQTFPNVHRLSTVPNLFFFLEAVFDEWPQWKTEIPFCAFLFFFNRILLIFITHSENHQAPPTIHWIISQIHPSSWSHSLLYLLRVSLLPTDVTVPYCLTSLSLGSILLPRKKKN